jgi:hypothetical protein
MGGKGNACEILVGKPEGKKIFERSWRRCEYDIRMCFRGMVYKFVDWMYLAQDRDQWKYLVYTEMNLSVS